MDGLRILKLNPHNPIFQLFQPDLERDVGSQSLWWAPQPWTSPGRSCRCVGKWFGLLPGIRFGLISCFKLQYIKRLWKDMVYVVTPILFIIVTQAKSDGESRKTDIFPGLPRYGQATTCGQGNLGAASGNNQLLKKRPPTWREVFRPPEMSSVNFRIRKKYIQPRTYLWKIFCTWSRDTQFQDRAG